MKFIKLSCKCGAQLEVDIDNMQAYCPYCGRKLLFDIDQMEVVLAEKEKTKRAQEKTKRAQMEYEYKDKKDQRDNVISDRNFKKGAVFYLIILILIIGPISYLEYKENYEHQVNNEIQVSISSEELNDRNYIDVVKIFESAEFKNIELIKNDDLVFGILSKDGSVESITINGHSEFTEEDWFPADATVTITYHTFPEE